MFSEVTIPTGSRPSTEGILDAVINFATSKNGSMMIVVVLAMILILMVSRSIGGAVATIVGKLAVPIGIALVVAAIVGYSAIAGK